MVWPVSSIRQEAMAAAEAVDRVIAIIAALEVRAFTQDPLTLTQQGKAMTVEQELLLFTAVAAVVQVELAQQALAQLVPAVLALSLVLLA